MSEHTAEPHDSSAAYAPQNVLLRQQGTPTNGPATVQIGTAPALTLEQVRDVLLVGGMSYVRATMAASQLLRGTTAQPIITRTAQDLFNETEAQELRQHRAFLLGLVRKRLSPLRLRALDALIDWHFASTLGEQLGLTLQHASNICAALYEMGLVERQDAPEHLRGRSPWLYRTVDAVHGPERGERQAEAVRDAALRLRRERAS